MPKNEFEGVRITSIDNFQGEENDIIILSLVRSNSMGITGFLKIDNRICVALSRARKGLFVIGNFELLCSESELWRYVVNLMKDRNSFGKSLILQCGNHPGNSAEVSRDSDFDQVSNGGCYLPCNFILNCSHKCGQICHVSDPKHELYKCLQPCLKKCDNGHFCQRKCFQDCEACKVKVIKTIPSCGHVENVPCSVNEDQWSCKAPCNTILPCIHICKGTCGKCRTQNTHAQCLEPCKKRLSCGHIIDAKCSDDEKSLICKSPCNSKLECGHLCTGTCNACQQGRLHIPCQSKSDGKRLSCGHIIDAICSADEENLVCMKPCGGKLECGHVCSGSCNDCQQGRLHIPCQSKCNRKLICGHRCLALCVKGCPPCDQNCQTACEHTKCMSKCSDPCEDCRNPCSRRCIHQACEKFCSEKCIKLPCSRNCNKTLSCGHACLGICGESCPQMCTDCHLLTFQDSSCEIDKGVRLVTLNDCNHTFCVDSLDRYMFNRSSSVALTLPQCPICFAHIKKSVRYKHVVEELRNDMKTIKRRIHEEKTSSWKIKLKYVKEKVTMLKAKDSEAVGFIVKQLNEGKTELFERVEFAHAQVIILEIIYSIYRSILESVIENTKEEKLIGLQLKRIRQWLFESRRTITKKKTKTVQLQTRYCFSRQELSEVRLELLRLAYLVQFLKFTESGGLKCTTELQELFKKSPFSETKCTRIRLSARVYGIGFDEGLFNDLVSPDVLQHYRIWQYGNWFKCRSGHISNTDQDQTKCPSCEIVIGMKVCHEVIPPKLIVSVPKPDDRKKKAVSSLDDIIQKQMEMMESPQTVGKEIDKSNSLASSQPDSTFKSLYERNISKKVTESSHEENTDVSLLPKNVENKASAILSWQKVSQNQECRKPDTDYSMVSNDSEYPTEVKKWAVHSNRISTDGNIPMENKQTSLKSFQLASLAEALSRPEMKYVQQKTDSTTRKIQNEIPNPTNVSGYKSASSGGDQELTKKVYGTKELLRFKENQGAGFVERNLRERQEEDMDVDYADVSVRQALGGARTYTKSSKCVRSPIDLDIQYDDLAKERGAQVAVIKSEGKEIQRKEPEIEKPSKPDVYQPDVYQPRGLRRRECPKGHMLFRDDEKCRWCDPFRDSPV